MTNLSYENRLRWRFTGKRRRGMIISGWTDDSVGNVSSLYHNQSPLPKCLPLETPLARLLMINCTVPASYNMLQLHTSQCHLAKHLAYNGDILLKPIFFLSSTVEHRGKPENSIPIQLLETVLCFWRYWLLTLPSRVPQGTAFARGHPLMLGRSSM